MGTGTGTGIENFQKHGTVTGTGTGRSKKCGYGYGVSDGISTGNGKYIRKIRISFQDPAESKISISDDSSDIFSCEAEILLQ